MLKDDSVVLVKNYGKINLKLKELMDKKILPEIIWSVPFILVLK